MKKISITIVLLMLTSIVFSQKDTTIYYSNADKTVKSKDSASTYFNVARIDENTFKLLEYYRYYFKNSDDKWYERTPLSVKKINDSTYYFTDLKNSNEKGNAFTRVFIKSNEGYIIKEFKNNYLTSSGFSYMVFPLIKEGEWTYYYPNTYKERKVEIYKENQAISNRNFDEYGDEIMKDVFDDAEEMPEFKDGIDGLNKFLRENIKYPQEAREDGLQGKVYITFIVMEDGTLSGIELLKGASKSLDEEAMRVVKLMDKKWKPGKLNNKPVRVRFNLPIQFNLT